MIHERRGIHDAWVLDPPPLSRAETVAAIDRDIDDAVRTLASSRAFSVDDRRVSEASNSLAAAREAEGQLRQTMAKYPPGTAEAAELEQDWDALREVVSSLAAPIAPGEPWRSSLFPSTDEESRRAIQTAADAGIDAAKRLDLPGIKRAYGLLKNAWIAYTSKHIAAAASAAVGPVCHDWQDLELQQLGVAQRVLNRQPASEEVVGLERRLDRARSNLEAVQPNSPDCIAQVQQATLELSMVTDQATRLPAAMESSGLTLTAQTDQSDMVKDKPILFTLKPPFPNWAPNTDLTVNWGDDQTSQIPAKPLGSEARLEHVYQTIGTFHPSVTADQGREIGTSQSEVFVKSSPATKIQRAGDIFLNLQFGLALLIALVVYFWRFHSGTVTFGAESVHYVQAFTLGFAAYAGVAVLPNVLGPVFS